MAPALTIKATRAVDAGDGLCAGGEVYGAVGEGDGHGDVGGARAEDEGAIDGLNSTSEEDVAFGAASCRMPPLVASRRPVLVTRRHRDR